MNDIQTWLDEGKTLANQATEGPWEADGREVSQHWSRPEPWQTIVGTEVACMSYCYGGTAEGVERDEDAKFIADSRTRLPQALNALQAVLDLHVQGKFYGEPGDPECDHADDYDGPDHFWGEYGTLCESTAIYPDDPFCAGCPRDEEFKLQPWPCPTVRAIQDAIKEQDA